MRGFLAGLLIGVIGVAGHTFYLQQQAQQDPCLDRCGDGTVCQDAVCVSAQPAPAAAKKRSNRKRRGRARSAAGAGKLRQPTASQMRASSGGQGLGKVDYVDLAGELGGAQKELGKEQVTAKVRRLDPEIIGCIQQAGRGYDLGGHTVRVEVGFRIERSGKVGKVQVKAPRLLLKQGLLACLRPPLRALVFPESSRALIMRYPYALD